jgi:hypothetical protein
MVRILLPPGESRVRTCMLAELDQTGESQMSLTDPDSRAMAAHTHVAVGYNVQIPEVARPSRSPRVRCRPGIPD